MLKRSLMLIPALFAAAFALGLAIAPVSAAPAAELDVAVIDALLVGDMDLDGSFVEEGDTLDHRGRRGRRGGNACASLAQEVKKACPCEGNDDDGWADHADYVDCVSDKLDELVDDEDEAQLECATKIIERAEASEIGNDGFECPTRDGECGRDKGGRDKGKRPAPPTPDPGN
jgi:hypothetical protein